MNGTPRLRSAYPQTPKSSRRNAASFEGLKSSPDKSKAATRSKSHGRGDDANAPLVPLSVIDGPTQRLYVSAFYILLTAWRLYDYYTLISNGTDSLWFFMKWVALDGVFLYGLPGLRIPWLEWSSSTITAVFLFHAIVNAVLMFRIPIPLGTWIVAFVKTFYDSELAVSELRVKPASLLHNSSLILGKQIVRILPEGSAKLNPGQEAFCIDSHSTTASLPIFINQTTPISIELLRIDLDTNLNETIAISAKEAKKLIKQADKQSGKQDTTRILRYPVKQTGLYRLQKVVDESNLEVQRVLSDTLVVRCPSASVKELARDKCRGELSNFLFQVDATPPIRIKYSKIVNRGDESSISLTVHPENLDSPLGQQRTSGALIKPGASGADVSWARTQHIEIPVNETLGLVGAWQYTIDEVQDGCGNVVSYNPNGDSNTRKSHKGALLHHTVKVHERPEAALYECSTQRPLKVAKGKSRYLPIWPNPSRQRDTGSAKLHIAYAFTPTMDDENGEGDTLVKTEKFTLDEAGRGPEISEPGTYVLTSVSTDFCSGEILEPTSCLLLNPPEPDLSITSENIPHKCAGNSVGLRVNLDLIGSPPFAVTYEIHRAGGRITPMTEHISHTRTQLEFTPRDAGHYTYEFVTVADDVYNTPRSLKHKQLKLEQDVKPTAFARFVDPSSQEACIQEPAEFDIALTGDAPWTLEYDLVHDGKRKKHKAQDINTQFHRLVTPNLQKGGQYSLTLTGITDASGCKIFLEQEVKIQVRHQRPSAAFGHIEGKRVAHMLEGRRLDLPLRLSGEPPWTLSYRKKGDTDRSPRTKQFSTANTVLSADSEDVYELLSVNDGVCPGTVEQSANLFEVLWVPRPTIRVTEDQTIKIDGGKYVKSPICEGDQDSMEISMTGNPPYFIKYHVHVKPELGRPRVAPKEETFGLHGTSIKMDTGTPGFYQYKFAEIGDQLYEPTAKNSPILIAQQTIHSRPSAKFVNSGKTYSYCKEQVSGDEVIPISLLGSPPFSLEMGIRHHATAKPEVMNIPHVTGNRYDFRIPQRLLSIGTHIVTIRKVVDSNGCQRSTDFDGPTIRVNVVDVPSIVPLEPTTDFCVGDPISFTLTGTPPFNVFYTFEGAERKAASSTNFRRIAERPGDFTITALSDKASTDACRALTDITKVIHPLPSVRISRGRTAEVDIHEGGDAEIMFEFGGTPPFKFTYTRSTNAEKGKKSVVLETKNDISQEHAKSIRVSDEGTYEVVSIRDRYCGITTQNVRGKSSRQLLTFA